MLGKAELGSEIEWNAVWMKLKWGRSRKWRQSRCTKRKRRRIERVRERESAL